MIVKFKHIENVNVTIWVSIVWLIIVAVAINITTHDLLKPDRHRH